MIEEYRFGLITIDGKTYNHDVEVRWLQKRFPHDTQGIPGEVLEWQRTESHIVNIKDVERALEQSPEVIVIGTGESGSMEVAEGTPDEIISRGIKLIINATEDAIKTFNIINEESEEEEGRQRRVIGLFHLTC